MPKPTDRRKPGPDIPRAARLLSAHVDTWLHAATGRTLAELCRLAKVPESGLSLWRSGKRAIPLGHPDVRDLADVLDLSPRQRRDLAEAYGLDPLTGPGAAPVPVRVDPIPVETGECPKCRVWWPLSGGVLARHAPLGTVWDSETCPGSGLPPLPCVAVDASG